MHNFIFTSWQFRTLCNCPKPDFYITIKSWKKSWNFVYSPDSRTSFILTRFLTHNIRILFTRNARNSWNLVYIQAKQLRTSFILTRFLSLKIRTLLPRNIMKNSCNFVYIQAAKRGTYFILTRFLSLKVLILLPRKIREALFTFKLNSSPEFLSLWRDFCRKFELHFPEKNPEKFVKLCFHWS